MGYIISRTFICGLAGAIAWLIMEPQFPKELAGMVSPEWAQAERIFILLVGALIGLAGGTLAGIRRGTKTHLIISIGAGLLLGILAGLAGYAAATVVYAQILPVNQLLARTFAFIPLGLCIGAAVGAAQFSMRGVLSGLLGGAVAGAVTGMLFDPVSTALSVATLAATAPGMEAEIGQPGRALMSVGIGLLVGLMTAIVDTVTRTAWIKVLSGSREGREFPIDSAEAYLGRDERAHIPLFGDNTVAPLAAVIRQNPGGHEVVDPGTAIGIYVNGHRVPAAQLNAGDQIQIGQHRLLFLTKAKSTAQHPQQYGAVGQHQAPGQGQWPNQPPGGYGPGPTGQGAPVSPMPQQQKQQPTQQPSPATPTGQQQVSTLVAMGQPKPGSRYPIHSPIEVGRESTLIPLSHDSQSSRRHVRLEPAPDGLTVIDLGSTNGTFINGTRVSTAVARRGDILRIGSTEFRVE